MPIKTDACFPTLEMIECHHPLGECKMSDLSCAKRHYNATGHGKITWGNPEGGAPGSRDEYCKECKTGIATVKKYKEQLKSGGKKMNRPPITGFPMLEKTEKMGDKVSDSLPEKKCKNGCDRKVAARGLCWKCYNDVRKKEAAENRKQRESEWEKDLKNKGVKKDSQAQPVTIQELKQAIQESLQIILDKRDSKSDIGALKYVIELLGKELSRLKKIEKNQPKLVSGNRTNTFTIPDKLAEEINKIAIMEYRTPIRQIYYFLDMSCQEYLNGAG